MEEIKTPTPNVEPQTTPNRFFHLPLPYVLSLGFLALVVLVLPVLTVTAEMTTRLNSKAYQPVSAIKEKIPTPSVTPFETPKKICNSDVQSTIFAGPCKQKVTPSLQRNTESDLKNTFVTDSISRPNEFFTSVTFICADGYSQVYTAKSCSPREELLAFAKKTCNDHGTCPTPTPITSCTVSAFSLGQTCVATKSGTFKSATYSCSNGLSGTLDLGKCATKEEFKLQATSRCAATCKPTNTPQPLPTTSCKTGISTWIAGDICKTNTSTGLMSAKYQCYNSAKTLTATLGKCVSKEELIRVAESYCLKTSPCPVVSPTVPRNTPTPLTTPTSNRAPIFTTTALTSATVGSFYSTYISAADYDSTDSLKISLRNLPDGISQGPCATPTTGGKISCQIYGTPSVAGQYPVIAIVSDSKGLTTNQEFPLTVNTVKN